VHGNSWKKGNGSVTLELATVARSSAGHRAAKLTRVIESSPLDLTIMERFTVPA